MRGGDDLGTATSPVPASGAVTRAPAELRLVADRACQGPGPRPGCRRPATGSRSPSPARADSWPCSTPCGPWPARAAGGWRWSPSTTGCGPARRPTPPSWPTMPRPSAFPARVRTLAPADLSQHRQAGPRARRAAKYGALWPAADELGCRWLATGHTLDDQAETVLLQLLRGEGPDRSGRHGRPRRPSAPAPARRPPGRDPSLLHRHRPGMARRTRPTPATAPAQPGPPTAAPLLEELRPGRPGPWPAPPPCPPTSATGSTSWSPTPWPPPWRGAGQPGAPSTRRGLPLPDGAPTTRGAGPARLDAEALAALPVALARRVVRAAARQAGGPVPDAAATDRILGLPAD